MSDWTPNASKRRTSPSRAANSITIPSASKRRATNNNASDELASSQCASSIRQRTGRSSASSESRVRQAAKTRNRWSAAPSSRPRALRSALAWGAGSLSKCTRAGRRSWSSAANGSSDSDSTPRAVMTCISDARSRASIRRAVLPIPGSPRTTAAPLFEARAPFEQHTDRLSLVVTPEEDGSLACFRAHQGKRRAA